MLLHWDVYEVRTEGSRIHGVRFRGRLRKFFLREGKTLLVENASDVLNVVRFAVLSGEDVSLVEAFLHEFFPDASVHLVLENVANPILSKLVINDVDRYVI